MKKKAIIPRLIPAIISSLKILFSPYADTKEQIPRDSLRTQFSVDEGEYLFISTECIGQNESATIDAWDETF